MNDGTTHPAPEPELVALSPDEPFQFACGPGVPCFNNCCKDLNQALMPYDVLQLRTHLKLSWSQFLEQYAAIYPGPSSGLPVVSLRFSAARKRNCPFVTPDGCRVYAARPTSCRLYPLARALQRSRRDGTLSEHFAVLREAHCRGFERGAHQTARQWVQNQGAQEGLAANDQLMELIALKNRMRPGPLDTEQQQWVVMAFYDLDRLKQEANAGRLKGTPPRAPSCLPDAQDNFAWLTWGLTWLRQALFGETR